MGRVESRPLPAGASLMMSVFSTEIGTDSFFMVPIINSLIVRFLSPIIDSLKAFLN
jgi:hypothetical protein